MEIIINNKFYQADSRSIPANDRGLLLGDGIFTTMKVIDGNIQFFAEHFIRLQRHAAIIALALPFTEVQLHQSCLDLLKHNKLEQQTVAIRITVTRGVGERGINLPQAATPTVIIKSCILSADNQPAVRLGLTSIIRNEYSFITKIKSLNYLEPIMARKEAMERGFDDGIMLNTRGAICECSIANLFFVTTNYEVITPHLSEGVLDGIMRQNVIDACKQLNIPILQRSIRPDDIYDCIEAFQTNCIIGIQHIAAIEDYIFPEHQDSVAQLINDYFN